MVMPWKHPGRSMRVFCLGIFSDVQVASGAALSSIEETKPVIERLDTKDRAFVFLTLLMLVLAGIVLALVIIVGGRWARRRARWRRGPTYFGGSAGSASGRNQRSVGIPTGAADGESISTAETLIDGGIKDTRQPDP